MPLEFRGLAIMDPPGRGIRFAGYPVAIRSSPLVICQVSIEALRVLGGMQDASAEEAAGIFEVYREAILKIASEKFDRGEHRPTVTVADLRM
jgi:hypothetical protein